MNQPPKQHISAHQIALFCLGMFGSITQGIFISSLRIEGLLIADVPMYALIFLVFRPKKQIPRSYMVYVFAVLVYLWPLTGFFFAPNKMYFYQDVIISTRALLFLIVAARSINSKQDLFLVVTGLLAGIAFQSTIGILQWRFGYLGLKKILGEAPKFRWRVGGTFRHTNIMALYLAMIIPFAYRSFLFLQLKRRWIYGIVLGLSVFALLATRGRACWIAVAFTVMVFLIIDLGRRRVFNRRVIGALALLVIATIGIGARYGQGIVRRFSDARESITAEKSSSRINLAKNAIGIYKENKWLGVGSNNYREYVFEGTAGLKIVHNIYLLILAENGLPGLMFFLLFLVSIFIYGWRYSKVKDPYIANIATAALMSILNVCIVGMTSPDLRLPYPKMFFYLIIGILLSIGKLMPKVKPSNRVTQSISNGDWKPRESNIILR
jgi:putative inorganic carbon (HCO3(-)) transporter